MVNYGFRKKISALIFILLFSLAFCGCSSGIELTDEESQKIAEYSAGLLLKHSRGYDGALSNAKYEPPVDPVTIGNDPEEVLSEETEEVVPEETAGGESDSSNSEKDTDSYFEGSVAEAINLPGFDVSYTGVEFTDKFPQDDGTDLVFSMQAQPGNQLVAIHFNVINVNDTATMCDILHNDVKFRFRINDSYLMNAQSTILLNDLKQMYSEFPGGAVQDCVLVIELTSEEAQQIQTMDLITVSNGERKKIKLF